MNPPPDNANIQQKLALAQQFFHEFYAACFWHMRPDLVVTEAMLPLILKGLKHHGGHKGLRAAAQLEE